MVPHIPPKGMQMMRYAGLYARNVKRKVAPTVHAALEALRLQFPPLDLEPLVQTFQHLKWRERIKASSGYDPLECPRCGCIMQLVLEVIVLLTTSASQRLIPGPVPPVKFVAARRAETVGDTARGEIGDE
jgi:hypothetical protein